MSQAERRQIVVQDVLQMLRNGQSREEIREHYDLKKTELKKLFKHPKLINKKTHAKPSFVIIDEEEQSNQAAPQDDNVNAASEEQIADFRNPQNDSEEEEDLTGRETFGATH